MHDACLAPTHKGRRYQQSGQRCNCTCWRWTRGCRLGLPAQVVCTIDSDDRAHINGDVVVLLQVMLVMDFLPKPLYIAMKELSMDKPAHHRHLEMLTDEDSFFPGCSVMTKQGDRCRRKKSAAAATNQQIEVNLSQGCAPLLTGPQRHTHSYHHSIDYRREWNPRPVQHETT